MMHQPEPNAAPPLPPTEPLIGLVELLHRAQLMCRENLVAHAAAYLHQLAVEAERHARAFHEVTVARMNHDLELSGVVPRSPRLHLAVHGTAGGINLAEARC